MGGLRGAGIVARQICEIIHVLFSCKTLLPCREEVISWIWLKYDGREVKWGDGCLNDQFSNFCRDIGGEL